MENNKNQKETTKINTQNIIKNMNKEKEKEKKKLKKLYKKLRRKIKEFDINYVIESSALMDVNKLYSNKSTEETAKNFFMLNLEESFRSYNPYCIAYPYNKIEECEAKIIDSLQLIENKLKKFTNSAETIKNKNIIKTYYDKLLTKNLPTNTKIKDKYKKYIKLSEYYNEVENTTTPPSFNEKGNKTLNSKSLNYYSFYNKENFNVEQTIEFLLHYSAKIKFNMKRMDLEKNAITTINDEFSKLLKYLKEKEIESLKSNSISKKLLIEYNLRKKAFNFIFKMGKIAETYAELHILKLHNKESSKVNFVKQNMYNYQNPSWEIVINIFNSLK